MLSSNYFNRWHIDIFSWIILLNILFKTIHDQLSHFLSGDKLQSTGIPLIILSFKPFFQGYRSLINQCSNLWNFAIFFMQIKSSIKSFFKFPAKPKLTHFQKVIIKLIFIFYGKYQVQENVYLKTTLNTSSQMLKLLLKGLHRFRLVICLIFWNSQNHIFMKKMIRKLRLFLWVK